METPNTTKKKQLLTEIKQLNDQHAALEVTRTRWVRLRTELEKRIAEIDREQLLINVAKWRAENEAGVEQLQMF